MCELPTVYGRICSGVGHASITITAVHNTSITCTYPVELGAVVILVTVIFHPVFQFMFSVGPLFKVAGPRVAVAFQSV